MLKNDNGMYRFSLFFRLCLNLERFVVLSDILSPSKYEQSIPINGVFLEEILKCTDILDETVNDTFTEFVIVEPTDSIEVFMEENEKMFRQRGWRMMKKPYTHQARAGKVNHTLYIQRVPN